MKQWVIPLGLAAFAVTACSSSTETVELGADAYEQVVDTNEYRYVYGEHETLLRQVDEASPGDRYDRTFDGELRGLTLYGDQLRIALDGGCPWTIEIDAVELTSAGEIVGVEVADQDSEHGICQLSDIPRYYQAEIEHSADFASEVDVSYQGEVETAQLRTVGGEPELVDEDEASEISDDPLRRI